MKTKFLFLMISLFVILSGCASLPEYKTVDGFYKFEIKMKKGDKRRYLEISENNILNNASALFPIIKQKSWNYSDILVEDVLDNGNYLMTEVMTKTERENIVPKYYKNWPIGKSSVFNHVLIDTLYDSKIKFEIDRTGRMASFEYEKDIAEKVARTFSEITGETYESQINEVKKSLHIGKNASERNKGIVNAYLPEKPVKIGETWTKQDSTTFWGIPVKTKIAYTLKAVEKEKYAIIEISGGVLKIEDKEKKLLAEIKVNGEIKVNLENGEEEKLFFERISTVTYLNTAKTPFAEDLTVEIKLRYDKELLKN